MAYRQLPYVLLYLINAFSNTLKVCFGIKIIEAKMKKKKKKCLYPPSSCPEDSPKTAI